MNTDIKLHKKDLPDDLHLGNVLAIDGEFMGLNIRRDPLCLIQISSGKSDAHIIQLDRSNFEKANKLMNRFTSVCKTMCNKKTEISKSLQDFEANNEKTN